jgi:hypothetical protein
MQTSSTSSSRLQHPMQHLLPRISLPSPSSSRALISQNKHVHTQYSQVFRSEPSKLGAWKHLVSMFPNRLPMALVLHTVHSPGINSQVFVSQCHTHLSGSPVHGSGVAQNSFALAAPQCLTGIGVSWSEKPITPGRISALHSGDGLSRYDARHGSSSFGIIPASNCIRGHATFHKKTSMSHPSPAE